MSAARIALYFGGALFAGLFIGGVAAPFIMLGLSLMGTQP